jgi:two-component system response regulator LytT
MTRTGLWAIMFARERKGENLMKVSVELSKEYNPPYAVIYADNVTADIQRAIDLLGTKDTPLIVEKEERMEIIKPTEVFMIRIEGGDTVIYTEKEKYLSRKRLYEIFNRLDSDFIQISKQTIVNFSYVKSVEAAFNGTLLLRLKNGESDYVSRKYLTDFKKRLGL